MTALNSLSESDFAKRDTEYLPLTYQPMGVYCDYLNKIDHVMIGLHSNVYKRLKTITSEYEYIYLLV